MSLRFDILIEIYLNLNPLFKKKCLFILFQTVLADGCRLLNHSKLINNANLLTDILIFSELVEFIRKGTMLEIIYGEFDQNFNHFDGMKLISIPIQRI